MSIETRVETLVLFRFKLRLVLVCLTLSSLFSYLPPLTRSLCLDTTVVPGRPK